MSIAAPSVSRETAGAIATLLRLIRPAWDQLATLNAVHDASRTHRDLADLTAGCVRIAQDRTATSPKAFDLDLFADHWRRTTTPTITSGPGTVNDSCPVPGHEGYWAHNCPGCKVDQRIARAHADRDERLHPRARFQEDQ